MSFDYQVMRGQHFSGMRNVQTLYTSAVLNQTHCTFYLSFNDLSQVAMSNRLFTEDVPVSELPCMNCKRIEMGEYGCYNGQREFHFFLQMKGLLFLQESVRLVGRLHPR